MAKIKLTTKAGYKNGYEAAAGNQPRNSPHRVGNAAEELWLAGFDAYMSGGASPEEPRKRRTKKEMKEKREAPPVSCLPPSMRIRKKPSWYKSLGPRGDSLLDLLFKARKKIETETDPELLELLHMEVADLVWTITVADGQKPSDDWEKHKADHNLNFDKTAA